jgi:hypothetical protein
MKLNPKVQKYQMREEQQRGESQVPVGEYNVGNKERIINPVRRVDVIRTTNYNLNRDLNRQAAGNTAVKNQIPDQVRIYRYNNNSLPQVNSNSNRGRIYNYEISRRTDYGSRNVQRGRLVSSVGSNHNVIQNNRGRVYISSSSGSPGIRGRYQSGLEEEYRPYIRGGIVKLKKWKYTTQTEINKIIMIQRWWRYILVLKREQREYEMSEISDRKSDSLSQGEGSERYHNYEEGQYRTTTKIKRNASEKIISGIKNRYIVETTTIQVFKNQNVVLKKVEPEVVTKEVKKVKIKSIREQMYELWMEENDCYTTQNFSIISKKKSEYIEQIEEYKNNIIRKRKSNKRINRKSSNL